MPPIDASNWRIGMSEQEHRSAIAAGVIASTVGTTIEWYDFLLYSIVTGLVFGKLFFSQIRPAVGVLQRSGCSISALSRARSARRSSAITAIASAARRR